MGALVEGLFGGGDKAAAREAQRQRELQQIAQTRSEEQLRGQQDDTARQVAATGKAPKGRRLLQNVDDGGLAETLGKM